MLSIVKTLIISGITDLMPELDLARLASHYLNQCVDCWPTLLQFPIQFYPK